MARKKVCALATIRTLLGKSQREMGRLLGISTRSIQSYEQGWRTTPAVVGKLAEFILALKQRQERRSRKPCWKVVKCPPRLRATCFAYQLDAGDLCWLVTGNRVRGKDLDSWERKLAACRKCPLMRRRVRGAR